MTQLIEFVKFDNGDRIFLERLDVPKDSIHIVLKRKGAKRNAVNQVIELSQSKTSKEVVN